MKSSPLKRRPPRRLAPTERDAAGRWWHAAQGRPCAACGGPPEPRMDGHHAIPKQRLRRDHPEHTWDLRNLVPLHRQCHADHEGARHRVPREALGASVEQLAAELGLTWLLDSIYGVYPPLPPHSIYGAYPVGEGG